MMATEPQVIARRLVAHNPADGSAVGEYAIADAAEVRRAVERARAAQTGWSKTPLRSRIAVIRRFQRVLHQCKDEVSAAITREAGKPVVEALLTEVLVVLDATRFLIDNAFRLLGSEAVPHGNPIMKTKRGRLVREPHGVIGIVSPWNYPFSIPATETLAALVAGNAVVVKPSEFTPGVVVKLGELLADAGLPEGLFQVVVGEGATGAALIASDIDKLIFTGSVPTGKRVAQAAAERLLPVVLELGGKDAMIVLDDADLDVAAAGAVWGAFVNAGQTCLSVERCYVHHSLYDRFTSTCAEKTAKLKVGNGMDPQTEVGPLIHERQLRIVEEQVADAVARGARVLTGGRRLPDLGANFYAPTVLSGVDDTMRILREETFGPVLPIMAYQTEAQAVELANDSEFGLSASVWTRDRARGEAIAAQLDAGTVMVNDAVTCFGISEAPHGGFKASGLGRTHGRMGLEEMVRVKYIDSDLLPTVKKVWWYGYGAGFAEQMRGFVDFLFAPGLGHRLRGGLQSTAALFRKRL
ncbi:MAG TPA: aldehyde dehydrogenase family protein [Terriglobales bacterium]|nr:aldehyde dehydrogenase family protein [Terriglobales bacterium]